jgi:cytosine/adenosine deaminase-related metal-dependent hydrolase
VIEASLGRRQRAFGSPGSSARSVHAPGGLDETGINDDRDMLQEMRMELRAHRVPRMHDAGVPSPGQVLRMATSGGAATTPTAAISARGRSARRPISC